MYASHCVVLFFLALSSCSQLIFALLYLPSFGPKLWRPNSVILSPNYRFQRFFFVNHQLNKQLRYFREVCNISTSDVQARLSLTAAAWARLSRATACVGVKPSQSRHRGLGLGYGF
jgi:hypothetical protein